MLSKQNFKIPEDPYQLFNWNIEWKMQEILDNAHIVYSWKCIIGAAEQGAEAVLHVLG